MVNLAYVNFRETFFLGLSSSLLKLLNIDAINIAGQGWPESESSSVFFTGRAFYELTIGRPDIFRALIRKARNRSTLVTSTPIYFPTFQVAIEGIKTCSCMMNQLTCNLQCCLLPIPTRQLSFLTDGSELSTKKYNNFAIVSTMRSQLKYERRRLKPQPIT